MKEVLATIAICVTLSIGAGSYTTNLAVSPTDHVAFSGSKGINIHAWFTWTKQTSPSSYQLPVFANAYGYLNDNEIIELYRCGFTFVRLTVDPAVFLLLSESALDTALRSLTSAIDRLRAGGLAVVVDMHPVRTVFPFGPDEGGGQHAFQKGPQSPLAQRYANAIAWLAEQLDKRYATTRQIAFELMNEPDLKCGDPLWTKQLTELHETVRAAAPGLALVLNGACWDGIEGLIALDPAAFHDENVLYTFHFYGIQDFTHSGQVGGMASSERALSALGDLPYPANARPREQVLDEVGRRAEQFGPIVKAEALRRAQHYLDSGFNRVQINAAMDSVVNWAAQHGIARSQILVGEFGVNGRRGTIFGPSNGDRLRWLADTRVAAESRQFRWALWQYRGSAGNDAFDLESTPHGPLLGGMLRALGLRPPSP